MMSREGFYFFENRFEVWQTAFAAGLNASLFGHGFGTISDVLKQTALQLSNNLRFQVVDSSHNIILDYWVQGGITAVTILLLLVGGAIIGFTKKHKVLELASFMAVSTTLLFNPASISSLLAFWWLIGQAFSNPTGDPTGDNGPEKD
jgi:O-antigen ligase